MKDEPYTVYLGHKRIFDYIEDTCRTFAKARRDLWHDPKVPPEEGIPRTIEWMKQVYG